MTLIRFEPYSGFAENVISDLLTDPDSAHLPKEGRIHEEAHIEVRRELAEVLERRLGMAVADYVQYKNRLAPNPEEQLGPMEDWSSD